jgi:hypothetical protein
MNINFEPAKKATKLVKVKFLRDGVAERRDFLKGAIAEIDEVDARLMSQAANANGIWTRPPIVEILT